MHVGGPRTLGTMPATEALHRLNLPTITREEGNTETDGSGILAALIPWLTLISAMASPSDSVEQKSSHYLVAKGFPTLLMKVVEKVWNLDFVKFG